MNKTNGLIPIERDWRYYMRIVFIFLAICSIALQIRYYRHSNDSYDTYWAPGDKAFQSGDYATALHDYKQYEDLYPENAYIHEAIAKALIKSGNLKGARAELIEAIDNADPERQNDEKHKWKMEIAAMDRSQ